MMTTLKTICSYRKEKIDPQSLQSNSYVSTDGMASNKKGIFRFSIPPAHGKVTRYLKDDILVSNIRPYFKKIWLADRDGGCSNDILVFTSNEHCSSEYLYWLLCNDKFFDYASATAKGTKMPRGDKNALLDYPIQKHNRQLQEAIVRILRPFQQQLAINSRINDHLLEYARTIFEKWLASTHINYVPVADIAEFNPDNYSPREQWPLVQYLDTGNITRGIVESYQAIDPQSERLPSRARRKVTSGDIIYSSVRPIQKHYGLILSPAKNVLVSTGFTVIRANDRLVCPELLYLFLTQDSVTKTLQQIAEQSVSTYPSIKADDLGALQFPLPSSKEAAELQPALKDIFGAIDSNRQECKQLAKLRDALLPKLMSGEIDVSWIDLKQLNGHLVRLRTLVIVSRSTVYCMRAPFVG